MRQFNRRRRAHAALVGLGVFALACGDQPVDLEAVKKALDPQQLESIDWRQQVQELYDEAKAAGEDVPDDVSDWVSEDFGRIGGWEYATISLASRDLRAMQLALDERGREKWECFHVIDRGDELVLMFKRRMSSYLGSIPLRELVRLFSLSPGFGSEP
jgi:hypothetical protein